MRRAEFDVNEHTDFVRCLEKLLFGNDGVKSYIVKSEFFRLSEIFKIKIFKRKSEKICVIVRLRAADITADINGFAVYRDVFAVLAYFAEAESAANTFLFSVGISDFNPIFVQYGLGKRP